jgi:phosphatidylglycerol:prolipoprotein diacylglycerol transferase
MPTGLKLGSITIHYYGLLIILGIILGLGLTANEAARKGMKLDFLIDALPWIFLGGVLGARIWHILTPPQSMVDHGITTRYYLTHLDEAIAIWKGGIGIFGAVMGGTTALFILGRVKKAPAAEWLDITAPGMALAQSVGRWGNYINQELYGLPSDLPWAITIDPQHRLAGYVETATYHPLFLYELIWSLLNMAFLLWVSRKFKDQLKPGSTFLIYLMFYGLGRFGLEFLRLDISIFRGININQAFIACVFILAAIVLYLRQRETWVRGVSE